MKKIYVVEFCIFLFLAILGISSIVVSSKLSVDLLPDVYFFEVEMYTQNEKPRPFNFFLWEHDFTTKEGVISFTINFDDTIENIVIDFPTFIDEKRTNIKLFDCGESISKCENEIDSKDIKLRYTENPVNQPRHTTLIVDDIPKNLEDKKVVISYNMDIIPQGLFIIHNPRNNLNYDKYAIDFQIGEAFDCEGECLKEMDGFEKYMVKGGKKDIKLRLLEESSNWRKFKLETINKKIIFWKNLLNGLGISILGSSIILIFKFIIDLLKERKNKNRVKLKERENKNMVNFQFRLIRKLLKHIRKKL
ncbi:hypothetical protein KJ599_02470 [bacterium]|nr:hypothetical protein [bacterium]